MHLLEFRLIRVQYIMILLILIFLHIPTTSSTSVNIFLIIFSEGTPVNCHGWLQDLPNVGPILTKKSLINNALCSKGTSSLLLLLFVKCISELPVLLFGYKPWIFCQNFFGLPVLLFRFSCLS